MLAVIFLVLFAGHALASLGQEPAPSAYLTKEELDQIHRDIRDLRGKIETRPKDFWDKLSSVSTLASGVLVTLIGIYATQSYSRRQREKEEAFKAQEITVNQVQTVEKFFPYLVEGDENKRRAALEAIAATGNKALALRLAYIFSGPGALDELNSKILVASSPSSQESHNKSEEIFASLKRSVVHITSMHGGLGTGFICAGWGLIITLDYVVENLPKALLSITSGGGGTVGGQVWLVDKDRGLALLSSGGSETIPLPLKPAPVEPGADVFSVGHSQSSSFMDLLGKISKYQVLAPDRICVDMVCYEGCSGAPVVTESGELLGVISEYNSDTKQCYLIPSTVVTDAFVRERSDPAVWEDRQKEEYMQKGRL